MNKNKLSEVRNAPRRSVIAELEECLEDAKAGRLQEFTLVGRYTGGLTYSAWAGPAEDWYKMYGKLMDMALEYREMKLKQTEVIDD